jgi:hypothetical protein
VWAWQGVDASPAVATDPGIAVFDTAERKVYQHSGRSPQFWLADPAVVDKYTQGLTVQARWAGEDGQLESGWTGVRYRNKLLVPDFDMPSNTAYGPQLEDMAIYTLDDGPDWDDHTGSVFQRFGPGRCRSRRGWSGCSRSATPPATRSARSGTSTRPPKAGLVTRGEGGFGPLLRPWRRVDF